MLTASVEGVGKSEMEDFKPKIALNVAIEHIVLRALNYGLGTCWISCLTRKWSKIFSTGVIISTLLP